MGCLGMGNGSVFQLVPQRFRKEIGVMTGLVGAAGGVGGYYLNVAMGNLYGVTNTYASGFFAFAAIAVVAVARPARRGPVLAASWLGAGGVAKRRRAAPRAHPGRPRRRGPGAGVRFQPGATLEKRTATQGRPYIGQPVGATLCGCPALSRRHRYVL